MVLNRKGFFLELGDHEAKTAEAKPQTNEVKVESAPESSQPSAAPVPVEEIAPAPVAVAAESKTDTTAESPEVETKAKPSRPLLKTSRLNWLQQTPQDQRLNSSPSPQRHFNLATPFAPASVVLATTWLDSAAWQPTCSKAEPAFASIVRPNPDPID